jgi:hypothetical protein
MFTYLQSKIRGTATTGPGVPPPGLTGFYWHFARQTRGWYGIMFVTSLAVALIDTRHSAVHRPAGFHHGGRGPAGGARR